MSTSSQEQNARPPRQGKTTLMLCLKFLVLAPICLVIWLELLPAYTWCLGQTTGFFMKHVLDMPIDKIVVAKDGFLNTQTTLTFVIDERLRTSQLGKLVTNVAPFLALVLATSALGIWRRLRAIVIGVLILFFSHALTIVLIFAMGRSSLPYAVGLISITLPFLLWIVLAYWEKLTVYFSDDVPTDKELQPLAKRKDR